MKILSIVGARPQFIKLGPLSKSIRSIHEEIIIHTGQHFDRIMSEQFFDDLHIPKPDYNLKIHGGNHGEQTGRMMVHLEKLVQKIKPEAIIVFGDTNSTMAGTLVGAKLQIPIIHVEAGLRSFNRAMPEEINRIVTDHTSSILFAPTKTAVSNLIKEGLEEKTYLSGDIMVDALLENIDVAKNKSTLIHTLNLKNEKYNLLTLHRPYNVDDPVRLKLILTKLAQSNKQIIFPVHPRTNIIIKKNNIKVGENIRLIKPQGYLDFLCLMDAAEKVLTDSGGIQKEAYILKKPCLTIRSETEWIETLTHGWNKIVNPENSQFVDSIDSTLKPKAHDEIFGHNVAPKMLSLINEYFLQR
ncbi:MAG: UDP-N-acetylglucosamine 2-epimerase (non-hydrolyzing) [Candidatus Marinimicrobia bacterium]|jgi:UDP-N-acetylglucosamine 2-epimerase|nr:UDP-N-acetylglucosamine 2-epimerase (non-hydrolyzing) [Candidatus Neomarinimicrobiota bacterium]MBT5758914.1 UDP-N-acetylglucosamine 2-epimerase (non-hydrolyzing) [Candidatus Neomarinimicrobiota bacterium]MBT7555832.1 UDP-N-acetylglucosamine 2-epimerase (non-hydrolyzing) [Candidatus Woesearchaeota archaeon]